MKYVFIGLAFIVVALLGSSCVRYKSTYTHTRDTVIVVVHDTTFVPGDSVAVVLVEQKIDTVFSEIEKDCPNLPKAKINKYKAAVKETCTIEQLTGGSIYYYSEALKCKLRVKFNGNESIAIWELDQKTIFDKETTVHVEQEKKSFWKQLKEGLGMFGYLFLVFVVGFVVGRVIRFR